MIKLINLMEEKQKKAGLVLLNEGLITEELLKKAEKQHKGTERLSRSNRS